MKSFDYQTLDVFTGAAFGGNQLAVFTDAQDLSDAEMQALAAEMNYSETTFVLPPSDPAHDARVRIFHRTAEMPFAGHPNVGTAFVLGRQQRIRKDRLLFEEMAGLVEARLWRDGETVSGAEIDAPQSLSVYESFAANDVAACAGLEPRDVRCASHPPTRASVGVDFVLAEVSDEALKRAAPDRSAFERVAEQYLGREASRLSLFLYCLPEREPLRARMFAPLAGTWEDPATGSAHSALAAFRLSLSDKEELSYEAVQGVEMGRPSRLHLKAKRTADGIRATVGGSCMPMFRGTYARPSG